MLPVLQPIIISDWLNYCGLPFLRTPHSTDFVLFISKIAISLDVQQ